MSVPAIRPQMIYNTQKNRYIESMRKGRYVKSRQGIPVLKMITRSIQHCARMVLRGIYPTERPTVRIKSLQSTKRVIAEVVDLEEPLYSLSQ